LLLMLCKKSIFVRVCIFSMIQFSTKIMFLQETAKLIFRLIACLKSKHPLSILAIFAS
jgi:hypothetical protein